MSETFEDKDQAPAESPQPGSLGFSFRCLTHQWSRASPLTPRCLPLPVQNTHDSNTHFIGCVDNVLRCRKHLV